jgi:hypothetical protein
VKHLRRLLAALVLVATLALAAAGCGSVAPTALSVNGHEFSESSIDDELEAIADNPALRDRASVSEGTLDAGLTAAWLTLLVEDQVVADELDRRGIEVTPEDLAGGPEAAAAFFGDPSVVEAFPRSLREKLAERFGRRIALLAQIAPAEEPDLQAAYDEFLTQQVAQCASGRFAAHVLVGTREEADAAASELAGGASFAEVARQRSTDEGSAVNGGELGCIDGQQFVPEFMAAVTSQPLDQVSAPVQSEFGFHLIVVRNTIPFDAVEELLQERAAQDTSAGDALIRRLTRRADVEVEKRYGRWVVQDGRGQVAPPVASGIPPAP